MKDRLKKQESTSIPPSQFHTTSRNLVIMFLCVFLGFILGGLIVAATSFNLVKDSILDTNQSLQKSEELTSEEKTLQKQVEIEGSYTAEMTSSFYLGGTPLKILMISTTDEQQIVLQRAGGEPYGQVVIEESIQGPCLSRIIPKTNGPIDKLQYVSEYKCGDRYQAVITTADLENKSGNFLDMDYDVKEVVQVNLNDYFSATYQESIYEIVGWLDEDLVIVKQKIFQDLESGYISYDEELYIFNAATLEKELIYSRFVEKE